MRRAVAGLALCLVACSGGSIGPKATTTTALPCLRVSNFFHATLEQHPDSALGAVKVGNLWYVSNADGASWIVDYDPTSGLDESGHIYPLNEQAKSVSRFGSARPVGGLGATATDPGAARSRECALEAEKAGR